jgi:hypothetical protein
VVWINEYFGPVSRDGKAFNQMQVYLDNQEKVVASVAIPEGNRDTFGESIRMMRERKLTFEEAVSSGDLGLMDKYRLERVRRELFEQLQQMPFA